MSVTPTDTVAPADALAERDRVVSERRHDRLRGIVGLLVSLLAIGGVALWASDQSAPRFPSSAQSWSWLLLGFALIALATAIRGARWDLILRRAGVDHRRIDAFALTVVGYMGNTILPARGGEVLRILLLSERSGARRREILGSILPERLLDAAALMVLFITLVFAGVADGSVGPWPAIAASALLVAGLVAGWIYLRVRVAGRLVGFADRVRPVARASRLLLTRTGVALFIVTCGVWLLEGLIFWLGARSLEVPLGVFEALFVVILASGSALVPAAPGYVGTYDAAALFALHAVGVSGGAAIGCVLLFRFVIFVPITVAGLGLMVGRYGGLRGALRRGSSAPPASAAPPA